MSASMMDLFTLVRLSSNYVLSTILCFYQHFFLMYPLLLQMQLVAWGRRGGGGGGGGWGWTLHVESMDGGSK